MAKHEHWSVPLWSEAIKQDSNRVTWTRRPEMQTKQRLRSKNWVHFRVIASLLLGAMALVGPAEPDILALWIVPLCIISLWPIGDNT